VRPALLAYFDLGFSLGLTDSAFAGEATAIPDIGNVGLVNPLGQGLAVDVPAPVLDAWRAEALVQIRRPEMELGWRDELGVPYGGFHAALSEAITESTVRECRLTVHAIGTVMVWLEFESSLDPTHMRGFAAAFEFAGYTPAVSEPLVRLAKERCASSVDVGEHHLARLTRRERPADNVDARGYVETRIFSYFSRLALCIDTGDMEALQTLPDSFGCRSEPISFAYHGRIYSNAAYAVVARSVADGTTDGASGDSSGNGDPRLEIERMLACIGIAHLALGACEALAALFRTEIDRQVEGYIRGASQGRSADDLNRLRTLALAVVTMTDVTMVTPTDEDQRYFRRFAAEAHLDHLRSSIQSSCEILYNVQAAEEQHQQERRESRLNSFFAFLTALTLVSVVVDSYAYVRDEDPLLASRQVRSLTLVVLLVGVTVFFASRWGILSRRKRR
jgi:hypothetical protein